MLKRQWIYLKEMYPLPARALVAIIIFFELYFVLLLNYGVTDLRIGTQEAVGTFTVFTFLMMLRIADDFKDFEVDGRLFAHRALPSGRVKHRDLRVLMAVAVAITLVLNVLFMNNLAFFAFLYIYGTLMSLWFFQRDKIRPNLMLALVTHNPIVMVMNIYVISFACIKYDLDPFTWTTVLLAFTLYFPGLIWEIARKVRAPGAETEYTTYSKIFGYRKVTRFIMVLTLVDVVTNLVLAYQVNRFALVLLVANVAWVMLVFRKFMADPERFTLVGKVDRYAFGTEGIMLLAVGAHLLLGFK